MPLELTTANPSGVPEHPDPETTTHDNLIVETSGYDQSTVDGRVSAVDHLISSESPLISITEEASQLDLIHISAQSEISPTQIPSIPTATNSYTINIQTKLPNWIPLPNWVKKTTEEPATTYQTSEPLPASTAPSFESTSSIEELSNTIEPSFQVTLPTTKVIESTSVITEQIIKPVTTSITTQATAPFTTSVTSPDTSTFTTQATTQVTTPVTISDTKQVTTRVTRPASQAVITSSTTRVTSESFPENTRQTVTRQVTSPVDTTTNQVTTSFIESVFTLPPIPVTLSTTVVKRTVSATDISNIDKLNTEGTTQISSVSSNTGVIVLEENFGKATTESGSIATSSKPANISSSIDLVTTRTETNQINPDTTQNNSTISNNFTISDKQAYNSTAPPCDDCEEHSWFWILAGIAIGGLVFGVICYAMGSCCSQISAAKLSRVESVEESPQTSSQPNSSTNPDLSLYGESYSRLIKHPKIELRSGHNGLPNNTSRKAKAKY